jgi:hypothetical protein
MSYVDDHDGHDNQSEIMNYGGGGLFDCAPGYKQDPYKIMFGLIILYIIYIMYFKTDTINNNNKYKYRRHPLNTIY